jgi:hypothetical protein
MAFASSYSDAMGDDIDDAIPIYTFDGTPDGNSNPASGAACQGHDSLDFTYTNEYRDIEDECVNEMQAEIETYLQDYEDNMYSWITCDPYVWDMTVWDCTL